MLYLTEEDVFGLINMRDAIPVVRGAFAALGTGAAMNVPRTRAKSPGIVLHNMHAAAGYLRMVGAKLYTTTSRGARFLVMLYSAEIGELEAMIEADHLGRLRTGAASGVATDLMARDEARNVGVFGSGTQARTQLEAVCAVRDIARVSVYSRDADRRARFAEEMSRDLGIPVQAVDRPESAVAGQDIVITATSSKTPVLGGRYLEPGTHLNVIGSNDLRKAEVDLATVGRADRIVCDSREACRSEAGDFVAAIVASVTNYERMSDLADVVNGVVPGRETVDEVTMFKSVGLAIEDVALGHEVLSRARERGVGRLLDI